LDALVRLERFTAVQLLYYQYSQCHSIGALCSVISEMIIGLFLCNLNAIKENVMSFEYGRI